MVVESHRSGFVSRRRVLVAGLIGLPVMVGGGLVWRWAASEDSHTTLQVPSGVPRRETRPILDPARFTGKASLAHRAAGEFPGVIDQLHCYCGCDRTAGHVSLLSCYVDGHAAT
jgi:hypothetical protein